MKSPNNLVGIPQRDLHNLMRAKNYEANTFKAVLSVLRFLKVLIRASIFGISSIHSSSSPMNLAKDTEMRR